MSNYILFVEDDTYFSEVLEASIEAEMPNVRVVTINELSVFVGVLEKLKAFPPDAILLDLMISTGGLKKNYPDIEDSDLKGGLSCINILNKFESTSKIPTIIISAIDISMIKDELGKNYSQIIGCIQKPIDKDDFTKIIEMLRSALILSGKSQKRKTGNTLEKFIESIEAKPGAFGFKVDLKKLLIKKKS